MAISGLGTLDIYSSYYSKNPLDKLQGNPLERADQKSEQTDKQGNENNQQELVRKPLSLNLGAIKSRPNASLESITLSMGNHQNAIEKSDAKLGTSAVDVDKAVSDMQKDSALMQYTYFVGDSNVISQDEDGVVIQKSPAAIQ